MQIQTPQQTPVQTSLRIQLRCHDCFAVGLIGISIMLSLRPIINDIIVIGKGKVEANGGFERGIGKISMGAMSWLCLSAHKMLLLPEAVLLSTGNNLISFSWTNVYPTGPVGLSIRT
jgi:hypothetical protein